MEAWRKVWRDAIVPLMSDEALHALYRGLINDDPRLCQGKTTEPPPLLAIQDFDVEQACAISYCGWQGDGLNTVGEVENKFAQLCFECDNLLGEPGGVRWFLNWYDETPRDMMRRELIEEVNREISIRQRGWSEPDWPEVWPIDSDSFT